MDDKITVGIADMKMAQQQGVLIAYALGSCVGVCLYDPSIRLAALLHILLPINSEGKNLLKFADTGVRETLRQMEARGASKERIVAKIAGGAKMFELANGSLSSIGQRNIDSVHRALLREGIHLVHEEVGGSIARTVLFDAATGQGCIRSYGKPETIL